MYTTNQGQQKKSEANGETLKYRRNEMDQQNHLKTFAQFISSTENPPSSDVQAVGHLMREWLEAMIVDGDTTVDTGAGLGIYDLWAKVNGKEIYICIKQKD